MQVFVYGTLKEGYGNNRILKNGDAEFIGYDRVRGYRLYNAGFPVATREVAFENDRITGEIWDIGDPDESGVAEETLQSLDWLEGEGSMYHRVTVETESGRTVSMYEGRAPFWDFHNMEKCPNVMDDDGHSIVYTWSRW